MNEESLLLWNMAQNLWALEDKKQGIEQEIKQIFEKAKGDGFNLRALRFIVLMGRMSKKKRDKFFRMVCLYEETLTAAAREVKSGNG
ncbi:MAG: DUF2312 domain-containing protein [Magnetococcales bacterium]|nr:DUF2312 domain-containing protein [Magnetococcales bacterium]